MWKKALPLFVLSGILLVGCTNKVAVPETNETPAEDVRDDTREWKNNLERDVEGHDFDDGTMNDNEGNIDENQKEDNIYDAEIDENVDKSQVEIIEDFNRKNDVE